MGPPGALHPQQSENSVPLSTVMLLNTSLNLRVPMRRSSRSMRTRRWQRYDLARASYFVARDPLCQDQKGGSCPFTAQNTVHFQVTRFLPVSICSGLRSMLSPRGAFAARTFRYFLFCSPL